MKKVIKKTIKKTVKKIAPVEETTEVGTDIQIEQENITTEPVEVVEKAQDNYRECTCGRLVLLPDGSDGNPSICECGIKHIR